MSLVWASIDAHYANIVAQETWGHLAPEKNVTYPVRCVYAVGCYGNDNLNPMPITADFGNLPDSPWSYDALIEFLQSQQNEEGKVYEVAGTFKNYRFKCQRRVILDVAAVAA